jgi:hypothetical protein
LNIVGRKSALSADAWIEIERRHLIGGESINGLAKEFEIDESALRRRINPKDQGTGKPTNPLRSLAESKIKAEGDLRVLSEQISRLPFARQDIVFDLAAMMANIKGHIFSAAEYGAKNAHQLSLVAHEKVMQIDDAEPLDEDYLREIAMLTKLSNESASTPLTLMAMRKEATAPDKPPRPVLTLKDFYATQRDSKQSQT